MKQRVNNKLYFLFGVIVLIVGCCFAIANIIGFIPIPNSTEVLAQKYLQAVLEEDFQAAIALTNPNLQCYHDISELINQDIAQFGDADIKNVIIETKYNEGSDEGMEFAIVSFDYRKHNGSDWQQGKMRLMTDTWTSILRFRALCGRISN